MPKDKDIFILKAANAPWEQYMPEYHVDAGKVRYLRRKGQGGREVARAGIWRGKMPERSQVTYEEAETVYVTKGRCRIETDDGEKFDLEAGDAMSFDKGSTVYWTLLTDDYEEFFVFS